MRSHEVTKSVAKPVFIKSQSVVHHSKSHGASPLGLSSLSFGYVNLQVDKPTPTTPAL